MQKRYSSLMEYTSLHNLSYQKAMLRAVTALVGVFILVWMVRRDSGSAAEPRSDALLRETRKICDEILIEERNELSRLLNQLKQEFGKFSCDQLELLSKLGYNVDQKVSKFGGWCKLAGASNSSEHMFDQGLAEALSIFFANKMVASFGDGPGTYKSFIEATRSLQLYDAYDGAPYGPETSEGKVKFLDLTVPQYGLPLYDWILSLEVAEHIPAQFEKIYIDNIVRHAREGVVLSWAVPGQGGLAHVNNRPFDYVIDIFANRGFVHAKNESLMLQRRSTLPWLQANVNVYRRRISKPEHGLDL